MNIWVNSIILGRTRPVVIIPQQYKERAPLSASTHTHTHRLDHIILSQSPQNIILLHYTNLTLFRNHLRLRLI